MRQSPQRHVMALLRLAIGETQKGMADLVECSVPTIQSIELGRLKLSQALAERVALQTGATMTWLLENETSKQPINFSGTIITKETFIQTQAELKRPHDAANDVDRIKMTYAFAIHYAGMVLSLALEQGKVDLYTYKLLSALRHLEKELQTLEPDPRDEFVYDPIARKKFNNGMVVALAEVRDQLRRWGKMAKQAPKTDVSQPSPSPSSKRSPGRKA